MDQKLALRPAFDAHTVVDEGIFLLSERGHKILTGALYCSLVPYLDGRYSEDEIVGEVAGVVAPAEAYYALGVLRRKGYVVETDACVSQARAAFWDDLGLDPRLTERLLREQTVAVTAFGNVSCAPTAHGLKDLGVALGTEGRFGVALTDDYLRGGLDEFNAASLVRGRSWMVAKPVGTILWIGPVFRPGRTACWECLAHRLRQNRPVETYLKARDGGSEMPQVGRGSVESALELAAHLVVVEAAKAIASAGDESPEATLVTLDLRRLQAERHTVVRRPQCRRCGPGRQPVEPLPIRLESRAKRFTWDGGYRTADPEETLSRYQHHVSPISGVVGFLKKVSAAEGSGITSYVAAHTSALAPHTLSGLREALAEVSAGKGVTDAQARASALGEALERYSGYFWGDECTQRASYRRIGSRALVPNTCMLFSDAQFQRRDEINARTSKFEHVPVPFDEGADVLWSPVWSLTTSEFKYLPTEYCYGYFRDPERRHPRFCLADSNGNAAGNNLEEAILQGFMELVERDSVGLWWYNRAVRPGIDMESVDNQYVQRMRHEYRALHRDIWFLDLTSDLGVPTFAAVSRRTDTEEEALVWGFGAHFDPTIAAVRALTELNQHLPRASLSERGAGFDSHPEVQDWYRTATLADHPYLAPHPTRHTLLSDHDVGWSEDLRDDVLRCQEIVERKGMDLLVLDQTRAEVGFPVVKVFVPGLRHFRSRFAPGRLYDVPAELGWVGRRLTEIELNPVPYLFP